MNFNYVLFASCFFIGLITVQSQEDLESKKADPYVSDKSLKDDSYEPQEFDYDPHQSDPNYDEELLTGTSHHSKRTPEQTKVEIEHIFKMADKNQDSNIDKQELQNYIVNNFKKLHDEGTDEEFYKADIDNDKKVSLSEFFVYRHDKTMQELDQIIKSDNATRAGALLKRVENEKVRYHAADDDKDGSLNIHEYKKMKYPIFFPDMVQTIILDYIKQMDDNVDGLVDKEEYLKFFHVDDPLNKTHEEESLKKHTTDFESFDKDKNGKIDSDEYTKIIKPGYEEQGKIEVDYLFGNSDDDNNGLLTLSEVLDQAPLWLDADEAEDEEESGHDEL